MEALSPDDPPRIGPFTPLARIGQGGMGRVYLARSRGGRPVAVKVIRAEYAEDPRFRIRFRREVEAARTVSGLYTASVLDAGPDDDNPWLATAYIPGPSLQQLIRDHGPLPERSARILAAGIAEALDAIHAAGLIHRDLKPSNVICGPDGPRVIDFGISHAVDGTSLTATGLVVGSPRYASPEQCRADAEVVPASDVFALGGVLVYATTGVPPFGDGPDHVQLYLVVHEQPDLAAVPAALRPIVMGCLDKEAANRPSIDRLLDELLPPHESVGGDGWLPAAAGGLLGSYAVASTTGSTELPTHPRPDQDAAGVSASVRRTDHTSHLPTGHDEATSTSQSTAASRPTHQASRAQQPPSQPPVRATRPTVPSPTRRRLLTGVVGVAAMAASGGAAWWAATSKDSKANATGTPPTGTASGTPSTTPSQTPATTPGISTPDPGSASSTGPAPPLKDAIWTTPINLTYGNRAIARGGRLVGIYQNSVAANNPLTLVALKTGDGKPAWQQSLPVTDSSAESSATPFAADDNAVYTYSGGTVTLWSLSDGIRLGTVATGLPVSTGTDNTVSNSSILGLVGGVLFVGVAFPDPGDAVCLVGVDVTAKKVLWSRKSSDLRQNLPSGVAAADALVVITVPDDGGLAYVSLSDSMTTRLVKALSPTTGKEVWSTPFSHRTTNQAKQHFPTVTAAGGAVYLTDMHSGYLHAYDSTGKWKWTYPHSVSSDSASVPLTSRFTGTVAVADGTVYAADTTMVHAFDAATGQPKWAKPADFTAGLRTSPVTAAGQVWAEADTPADGPGPLTLFALDPATGQPGTKISIPLAPTGTTADYLAADKDTLYVVSASGAVLAYRPAHS
jgi:serine/threonine protein kinase